MFSHEKNSLTRITQIFKSVKLSDSVSLWLSMFPARHNILNRRERPEFYLIGRLKKLG
jgi:hypothetical protein